MQQVHRIPDPAEIKKGFGVLMQDLEDRIARLEAAMNQVVRIGIVSSVQADKGTVRVKLPDSDNIISKPLPVLFSRTQDNKAYDMPDIGEQVVCLFLPNGFEQGFVLGSSYSGPDTPPVTDRNKTHYTWPNDTYVEYDRKAEKMTVFVKGDIAITATENITINGERIDLN